MPGEIQSDEDDFGRRHSRVISNDPPDLCFAGHNNDTRGDLRNIADDAKLAAEAIAGSRRQA